MRIRVTLDVKAPGGQWGLAEINNRASHATYYVVDAEMKKWGKTSGIYLVTYNVDTDDQQEAYSLMATRLNAWFAEDLGKTAPYPMGSLLWWGTRKETMFPKEEE